MAAIAKSKIKIANLLLSNRINSDRGVALPMSLLSLVVLATLFLKNDELSPAAMINDRGRDFGRSNQSLIRIGIFARRQQRI